jgi:hypothetical protein
MRRHSTFCAGIRDFQEQFEIVETRFRPLEVWIWYAYFTLFSAGTLGSHKVSDVSCTTEVSAVLHPVRIFDAQTAPGVTSTVERFANHNYLVFPASWSKSFQITDLMKRI